MKWLHASVLAGVLMLAPLTALAAVPGIPHQFYGTVSYDSGTVPEGLTVRALAGSAVISTSVIQNGGKYGVMPDLLIVADQEAGATILFTVNGTPARETASFANGTLSQLNLTVPGASPTSATPPPENPPAGGNNNAGNTSGGGGGSGGGSSPITNTAQPPATATLTDAQKAYDTNGDDKIDVMDFNALIVHWGETGEGVMADFDGNGVVDVFDFNSLMVHWTA